MPQPSSVKRRKTPTRTPTVTRPRRLILGRGLLRITNGGSTFQSGRCLTVRHLSRGRARLGGAATREGLQRGERVVHGGHLGHRKPVHSVAQCFGAVSLGH